jgi:hypothetical protein
MAVTGTLVLKARCAICGSDRIRLPDVATDKCEVQCHANHLLGSYADVKAALFEGPISASNVDRSEPVFEPLRKETAHKTVRPPVVDWSEDGDPYIRFFLINGTHSDVKMSHGLLDQLGREIPVKLSEQTLRPK